MPVYSDELCVATSKTSLSQLDEAACESCFAKQTAQTESDSFSELLARNLAEASRPMALVFLDVDGVLNRDCTDDADVYATDTPFMVLSRSCVRRFARLVQDTNAYVVLSSSWRTSPALTMDLWAALQEFGVPACRLVGTTPIFEGPQRRDLEIQAWLQDIPVDDVPSWVVLDDMDLTRRSTVEGHFIRTNPFRGLTDENVERAAELLYGCKG